MRWLSKYMIWIMAYIGFINAVDSWTIPIWAKILLNMFALLAWVLWDQYDKPSKKGED